ncbi:MAG: sodium:proton antiporter [Rhodomicrobium sp.]
MDESLRQAVALLAIAIVVAIAARQFRLPYTVGLVIVGAILTLSKPGFVPHLTHDLIFDLLLPPLLFEAALSMSWRELQRDFFPIAVLATLGTVIAACVVTGGMVWLLDWPAPSALVFGVLIAATDPVAIIAMFKDNKLKGRLCVLVEGESLLNDGAAAVLFVMALAWAQAAGHTQASFATVTTLVRIVLGGVIIGAVFGGVAVLVAKRTSEHLIEGALTMVAAYGSFSAADYFDVSGVLATVTAGLVLGNLDLLSSDKKGYLSLKGREFVISFWEFAAFLANSVVFLLIGIDVAAMPFQSYGVPVLLASIALVLLGRGLVVYPLSLLFLRSRWEISLREQHVLWWGGLRGALGLALALSLPQTLPLRHEIVVVTFGVVAFSIVVQGLTMPLLLRRSGFLPK